MKRGRSPRFQALTCSSSTLRMALLASPASPASSASVIESKQTTEKGFIQSSDCSLLVVLVQLDPGVAGRLFKFQLDALGKLFHIEVVKPLFFGLLLLGRGDSRRHRHGHGNSRRGRRRSGHKAGRRRWGRRPWRGSGGPRRAGGGN